MNLADQENNGEMGRLLLTEFAEAFGQSSSKILGASGWVVYVVGPELKIKHFLASQTAAAELTEYEKSYALLDPLAPANYVPESRFVACLHQELSPDCPEHIKYRNSFMARHRIADALEIILRSDAQIMLGCSLIRHGNSSFFSQTEIGQAEGLRQLGEFTLSHLLPKQRLSVEKITERFPELTRREVILLRLVVAGLNNNQLSNELNISLPTVKSHLLSIFRKLNVRSRSELTAKVLL